MKRIIGFSIGHPWWVIAIVLGVTVFFAFQIPKVKIDPRIEIVLRDNNPVEALYSENKEAFASYVDILIGMLSTDIYTPSSLAKIREIAGEIEGMPEVRKVTHILNVKYIEGSEAGLDVSPMTEEGTVPATPEEIAQLKAKAGSWDLYTGTYITEDGTGTALSVVLHDGVETDDIVPLYYRLMDLLERYQGPEEFFISGPTVIEALQGHYMLKDLNIFIPLIAGVTLVLLFLFFRSFRGVALPLISLGIATVWTMGLMAILGIPLTVTTSVLPVVLIAVGSAYGIHVMENVFSDAAEGRKGIPGLTSAVQRVRLPVIMAGCTTAAAFSSLTTSAIVPLKHFGALSAFGILAALALSLTFIPALMALITSRFREYVPHHHSSRDFIGPVLKRLSRLSVAHSWLIIGIGAVLFLAACFGALRVKTDLNLIEDFRPSSPIRVADRILNEKFGGTALFNVEFDTTGPDDIKEPAVLESMELLQNELMGLENIGKAVSLVDLVKKMNQAMHDGDPAFYTIPPSRELIAQYLLLFSFSGGGSELESFADYGYEKGQILLQMKSQSAYLAQKVEDTVNAFYASGKTPDDVTGVITTGLAMLAKEFNRLVIQSQFRSFGVSLVLVVLITALIFRSFKLGLYSVIPLVVPVVLNFGIMGFAGIKLNAATAIIASLGIGMGIDYSIHVLSRYRHEIHVHDDVPRAIDIALNTSGRAILYNALAVAVGFLVLVPSNFVIISELGILVALIMITTSLASLTILPATLMVLPPDLSRDMEPGVVTIRVVKTPAVSVTGEKAPDAVRNEKEKPYREVVQ